MANTVYDGRFKSIHDSDLFFWKSSTSPTISSTTSSVSDIIDLGEAQVFANIPVAIMFDSTATVSALSQNSVALTADKIYIPGFFLQDASDGSTFSDIAFVKWPASASFAVTAAAFGQMTLGVVSCRRYVRLQQRCGVGTSGDVRAWLRMGLTA